MKTETNLKSMKILESLFLKDTEHIKGKTAAKLIFKKKQLSDCWKIDSYFQKMMASL